MVDERTASTVSNGALDGTEDQVAMTAGSTSHNMASKPTPDGQAEELASNENVEGFSNDHADGRQVGDDIGGVPVEVEHVSASKKKKKKPSKPKSKRGQVASPNVKLASID